jgi:hypothetical protein
MREIERMALADRELTARYAKKTSPYTDGVLDGRKMYINADMEYKTADSMIISAAKRGCFDAPGIRDIRRIRVIMIIVEAVVVATDNAIQEIRRAL